MKKRAENPPIIYSSGIENIITFFNTVKQKYRDTEEYKDISNDETQDILHTLELCELSASERKKIFEALGNIRRTRRVTKNESDILSPIIEWCCTHEKELKSLEELLGTVRKIEEKVNGCKYYSNRTNIIKNILGEETVDGFLPKSDNTPQKVGVDSDQSENEEWKAIIRVPVAIFYSNRKIGKRNYPIYQYTFPGIENITSPHYFKSGDPVLNIKNKKFMFEIASSFKKVLLQYTRRELPEPLTASQIDLGEIKSSLNITGESESRIIFCDYKCLQRTDGTWELVQ